MNTATAIKLYDVEVNKDMKPCINCNIHFWHTVAYGNKHWCVWCWHRIVK